MKNTVLEILLDIHDFMYSVILNGLIEKMLPNYIKEGLDWLQN